jgi:hypothetical protein
MMAMYIPYREGATIDPVTFYIITGIGALSIGAWIYMCMKAEVTRA